MPKTSQKPFDPSDHLPSVIVAEFKGVNKDGDVLLAPASDVKGSENEPVIYLSTRGSRDKGPAMGPGNKALVRLTHIAGKTQEYRAEIIKQLTSTSPVIMGVFHGSEGGGRVTPVDKKMRDEIVIDQSEVKVTQDGELALAECSPKKVRGHHMGQRAGRIRERLGDITAPRSISLIAIHAHGIPTEFPASAIALAEAAKPVTLKGRTDMRDIALVTIDPADARDHDDAIFAEADSDPANKDGWHLVIAIADVAHYVTPESPLDREALKRGNSCYFPADRVVPMLPEAPSNGLCSLKPGEDRACMAVHVWINAAGEKIRHKFVRGLMRSRENISYREAQDAIDGFPSEKTEPWTESVLKPLHAAWTAMMIERGKRGPLELDLPERKIELDESGKINSITLRERFDAHKIVEEFMICANVCAAEELEKHKMPAMYRVHEDPPMDKLETLRDFLATMDLSLTKGTISRPSQFNGVLKQAHGTDNEHLVNEVILRSQTQAYYSPDNLGHFGLALRRYAHFTSPIRRYADLLVHRGLIAALGFGDDGLTDSEKRDFAEIGQQISDTERRAMAAERDSTDRYMAAYLGDQVGQTFSGRIRGVTRFGLFVELEPLAVMASSHSPA